MTPRDASLYELFDEQVAILIDGARVLEEDLGSFEDPVAASDRLREIEHEGDAINHGLMARLDGAFEPPFERGAVQALAGGLDDILDLAEGVVDKVVLYRLPAPPAGAADQADLLRQACELLGEAIGHLARPIELRPYPARLHAIEKTADALYRSLIGRLFDDATDVRLVLIGKEIHGSLEDAIDRADAVGRVLERIGSAYGGPW